MYFINGMFWQQAETPYIGTAPGPGVVVVLSEHQISAMFNGIIGLACMSDRSDGSLEDRFGASIVTSLVLRKDKVTFVKQYKQLSNPESEIQYQFTLGENGVWIGTWKSTTLGSGEARCMITHIPENFYVKSDTAIPPKRK